LALADAAAWRVAALRLVRRHTHEFVITPID
jgi:hypothetical protein